jgi:hypothetical protein
MYKKTTVGCVCMLIAISGCTRNRIQQDDKVNILPTENELAHANYGKPINTAEFENAVKATLKDPYSAHVTCTLPVKGWYNSFKIIYAYASTCNVNAKNDFGAYTGEKTLVYIKAVLSGSKEYISEDQILTYYWQEKWHSVK